MLNVKYVLVERLEEEKEEGFQVVKVEDSSLYKGKIYDLPEPPTYMGNYLLTIGDTVIFAKNSPNTHLITREGKELKYILIEDLLEVL